MAKIDLSKRLLTFVEDHPTGWGHDAWLRLLATLDSEGADVSDPEAIGLALERARLADALKKSSVQGLGPKRIQAVVDRFENLWNLQHATVEEIADLPTVPAKLAQKVHSAVN
ncbi:MAG: helix-hairpin-helix domain-containing protein [Longimicrobiales bacterium]